MLGTHWHGALENDGFRRAFLAEVGRQAGRDGVRRRPRTPLRRAAGGPLDLLGDLVEEHLDTDALGL